MVKNSFLGDISIPLSFTLFLLYETDEDFLLVEIYVPMHSRRLYLFQSAAHRVIPQTISPFLCEESVEVFFARFFHIPSYPTFRRTLNGLGDSSRVLVSLSAAIHL